MKRFYYVLLLLLCLSSCGKDDSISNNNSGNNSSNGNSSQTPTSEYYIKYTASRRGYPISNASVKITDEKGQTIDIVTDKFTSGLINKSEILEIYKYCFKRYIIDERKWMRYARRRNAHMVLNDFLKEVKE